jgi:tripeptide aminopeptidase
MSDVVDRFVRYCEVASQSDPLNAAEVPSTKSQFDIARVIADDLTELGAADVELDDHAYVTAHWPASAGCEDLPCLGFCCHIDTAWQAKGDEVHPRIVHYEGGPLVMGTVDGHEVSCDPTTNPELDGLAGGDIVTTDGTSLLGGDDKAGDAEVMSLLARLKADPSIPHPPLALSFVPDEEIGHGAALLDLDRWGATWGYTLDNPGMAEFSYECFNAAEAKVRATGLSVHTGNAKGIMINASEAVMRFHQLIPAQEKPEYTEGYDGFYYVERIEGNCEEALADYIIRDHDSDRFAARKRLMENACAYVNELFGTEVHLVDNARTAFGDHGYDMRIVPMRGGTDGAQLCFRGLPCPNLPAGYHNAHGPKEFVPVRELEDMVDVLQTLVGLYAKPQDDTQTDHQE